MCEEIYGKGDGSPTPHERIQNAVNVLLWNGQTDGDHHKMWVIDQALKMLLGDRYNDVIKEYENDGEYEWHKGIAP